MMTKTYFPRISESEGKKPALVILNNNIYIEIHQSTKMHLQKITQCVQIHMFWVYIQMYVNIAIHLNDIPLFPTDPGICPA